MYKFRYSFGEFSFTDDYPETTRFRVVHDILKTQLGIRDKDHLSIIYNDRNLVPRMLDYRLHSIFFNHFNREISLYLRIFTLNNVFQIVENYGIIITSQIEDHIYRGYTSLGAYSLYNRLELANRNGTLMDTILSF